MADREASVVVRFVKVTQDAVDLIQQAFEVRCLNSANGQSAKNYGNVDHMLYKLVLTFL